jgi:hypothetical protein
MVIKGFTLVPSNNDAPAKIKKLAHSSIRTEMISLFFRCFRFWVLPSIVHCWPYNRYVLHLYVHGQQVNLWIYFCLLLSFCQYSWRPLFSYFIKRTESSCFASTDSKEWTGKKWIYYTEPFKLQDKLPIERMFYMWKKYGIVTLKWLPLWTNQKHENASHPMTMLEYATVTLKWLPLWTNQKARKHISSNDNAWRGYRDSQMAFPLNQSKSTKTHLIQSQCMNMVPWHSNGFLSEPVKKHENTSHPITMLEEATVTLKWLSLWTNQKARKRI